MYNDESFIDTLNRSETLFLGTAIETKPAAPSSCQNVDITRIRPGLEPMVVCNGEMVTGFRVTTPVKGNVGDTFDVYHSVQDGMCGVTFRPGAPKAVNAYLHNGKYSTGLCSSFGFSAAALQTYAEAGPEERSCIEKLPEAYAPFIRPEALADYLDASTEKEPYSLKMLNVDPTCEAYWPEYQKVFGNNASQLFDHLISGTFETGE